MLKKKRIIKEYYMRHAWNYLSENVSRGRTVFLSHSISLAFTTPNRLMISYDTSSIDNGLE